MSPIAITIQELFKAVLLGRECPVCLERHHNLEAHHYVDHAGDL